MTAQLFKPLAVRALPKPAGVVGTAVPVLPTNHLAGAVADLAASSLPSVKMQLAAQSIRPIVTEVEQ